MVALKENENKLSFVDLPYESLDSLAKVFQDSKKSGKYPRDNHFKPTVNTDLLDAMQRHLSALMKGIDIDDSGNSHYAHLMANAAIAEYHFKNGTLIDNRLKRNKNENVF